MALDAQRFRDNDTLNRCLDSGYRMYRGERDSEAVKRLQLALYDLGYPDIARIDGIWGDRTDDAVRSFKTDERLHPTDPVASRGTIGQLDAYFAWEPAWPDHPDASTDGLVDLAETTAAAASTYAEDTVAALDAVAWGGPPASPEEEPIRSALRTHVGLDAGRPGTDTETQRTKLLETLSRVASLLSSPLHDMQFGAMDRPTWHDEAGWSYYWAYLRRFAEGDIVVTPPFRNALTPANRAAILLRLAAREVDSTMTTYAYPGTARYGSLTPRARAANPVGLSSLVLFVGAGVTEENRPPPTWGDLSSLP